MQLYPYLITLLETTAEKNTVSTDITGDQVRSPEDLPERLIAGMLDSESFHYSEADGKAQWSATWKSWNDELRLDVSWIAGKKWTASISWKDANLISAAAASDAPLSRVLEKLRGVYSSMCQCPYAMDFLPAKRKKFSLPDGPRLMLFMPIHADDIQALLDSLKAHREQFVTDVIVRIGLVEVQVTKPATDYLSELSPRGMHESTGVRLHVGQELLSGSCCGANGIYVAGVHLGFADLPLMQNIWKKIPPRFPYFSGQGMDISAADSAAKVKIAKVKRMHLFWSIEGEGWSSWYRFDTALHALFDPYDRDIEVDIFDDLTGMELLRIAYEYAEELGY